MQYVIKRDTATVATVKPTGTQTRRAMGEDVVDMVWSSISPVDVRVGDTVVVHGQTYKLNRPASVVKKSSRHYEYEAQWEAVFYDLAKVQLRGLGPTNQLTESEFTIMADAATMVDLIVQNANRIYSGWQIGVVDVTEMQNFVISGQNCLQTLNQIAEVFASEFWIDNQVVHFQRREQSSGLVLSYGKGNGLYELSRLRKNDTNIVTRLYVEGGSRNLPTGYGKTRLQLPLAKRPYLEVPDSDEIIEATQIFENIIPERVGTLTGVNGSDIFEFTDSSMDFDVNDHLMTGIKAKVGFQTGALAGYEFELDSYDGITKTFKIVLKTDEKAHPDGLPNATMKPAVGDKYALFDIVLPTTYVMDAEDRLEAAGQAYLDKYSEVQYDYGARLTPLWVKQEEPTITLGYTVELEDTALDIDKEIRIGGYVRDLQEPYTYELELTDTIEIAEIVRQYAQQERILYAIQTAGLLDPETMRRNLFLNRLSEREGYLYLGADKVKAGYADMAGHADTADLATYALDADKWDGFQFADYLNQPVRSGDAPMFAGVSSQVFVSGFSGYGYRIEQQGSDVHATFDKLTVRKEMNVYELVINQIRATNGSVWVSDAIKILSVAPSGGNYVCTIDTDGGTIGVPFVVNDILRCQRWTGRNVKYYVARVTAIGSGTFTVVKLDGGGVPESGDDVVRMGNTSNTARQGALYLTASDDNAPYIDVIDQVTSASLANKTKVRLGKLNGITDAAFGGALSGYGLYAQNAYITGSINVTGGNAATQSYANSQASAAQSAAIAAAASDATTKANNARTNAISAAATDATNKADAAQAAAIAAAQSYADGKASAAQAAAISAASADAQSKANAAQAAAEATALGYVNSLEIGAVNLFANTTALLNRVVVWGSGSINVETGSVASDLISVSENEQIISNYSTSQILFYDSSKNYIGALMPNRTTVSPEAGVSGLSSFTVPSGYSIAFMRVSFRSNFIQGTTLEDKKVKIEKGTKATDWSPAPEDVQAAIDAADTAAQAAQTAYNNLTASLKSLAYQDIEQVAYQGNTLVSGGYINTVLLNANYIRSNIINAGYINTLELDASVIKSGTISENVKSLVKNPAVTGSIEGWSGNGSTAYYLSTAFGSENTGAIINTSSGNAFVYSDWFDVDPAKIYEVSAWVYGNTTGNSKYFGLHATEVAGGTSNTLAVEPIINANGNVGADTTNFYFWQNTSAFTWIKITAYILPANFNPLDIVRSGLRVSNHARMKPNTKRIRLRFLNYYNEGTSRSIYIANPSVVEVSEQQLALNRIVRNAAATADAKAVTADGKAEDAQTAANLANTRIGNRTIISGGYIVTGLLNADAVRSKFMEAGLIQASEINVTSLFAQDVTATGAITANNFNLTQGKIGPMNVQAGSIWLGNEDTWTANQDVVRISAGYLLYRANGSNSNYRREVAANLYVNTLGGPLAESLRVTNTIPNARFGEGNNTALALIAQYGDINIALDIRAGDLVVGGAYYTSGIVVRSASYTCGANDSLVVCVTSGINITLPPNARLGRVIRVANVASTITISAGAGNGIIHARGHSGTGTTSISFGLNGIEFVHDGTNWIGI